ncbi:MAG TPA: DUF4397 domain-containing protein [Mucilaginibacter sp.]|jgi:hypothetical protein|nr:DUF4397 domain-containing protein [Mucilaginibacter sp.]
MKNPVTPLKRSLRLLFAPGAMVLLLSSCLKDNNNYYSPPVAYLSFVQASTDEPPLNFYLNNDLVNWSPIQYGDNFGYIRAYTGLRTANFDNAGTMGQVLSDTIRLNQNVYYTLFLANTAAHPQALLLTDSLSQPASGNATVRFVNLSPNEGAVDLQIKGANTTTIANKSFLGHSGFIAISAASAYTLQVNANGTSTALATLTNADIDAGGVYTIWFYGLKNSTTAADNPAIGIMTDARF